MKGGDREREKDFLSDFVSNLTTCISIVWYCVGGKRGQRQGQRGKRFKKGNIQNRTTNNYSHFNLSDVD
jgi:hypothetical protein